ncbi:Histidine phosphatase superfamily (branch 1) [Ferrimonas sediminum]|uniref:Histidine phosphatase superfamily (Branch 1) n=1 Tax=Ferrimonas sediminum TaxID=718193 RepID=A0A1G8S2Q7_9GAMM|nr:phosphoglycerate mutase family protein [Ferrimonas sediminum]SDJ23483.1 Histidine phosphatase superfamily (branch 1) [Ferrimonas sediminum]
MKGLIGSLLVLLATLHSPLAGADSAPSADVTQASMPLVVFLVRHAEKQQPGKDPELTQEGRDRARDLANLLQSAQIEAVHSTDFARTRATAGPTAAALNIELSLYDPFKLKAFANTLKRRGGRHLVVGHSNTTPALVTLLGGEAGDSIDDASEFDRLYVITQGGGVVETVLLRYGEP